MTETTVYLVRHGQIDANVERRWFGSTDSNLNAKGQQQADRLTSLFQKQYPAITASYSSPLKRTMSTAKGLTGEFFGPAKAHPGLREYAIGELEGIHFDALHAGHRFFDKIAADADYAPSGGESVNQVRDRMVDTLEELRLRHIGEEIAVISHGAAMAIALATLLKGSALPFNDYHMDNTGVSKLVLGKTPKLVFFNRVTHLEGL